MIKKTNTTQMIISWNTFGAARTQAATRGIATDLARLTRRAALTIPVWLGLRSALMAITMVMKEGVQHIIAFDKALARAAVVAHGIENVELFIGDLRKEIQQLALDTGVSVDKLAESFYRFGTAGLNAAERLPA